MPRMFRTRTICFIFVSLLTILGGFVGLRCLSCTKQSVWKTITYWLGEHGIVFDPPPPTAWQSTFDKIFNDWIEPKAPLELRNSETQVHELTEFIMHSPLPNKYFAVVELKTVAADFRVVREALDAIQPRVSDNINYIAATSNHVLEREWVTCLTGGSPDNTSVIATTLARQMMELAVLLLIIHVDTTAVALGGVKLRLGHIYRIAVQGDNVLENNRYHRYQPKLSMQLGGNHSDIDFPTEPEPLEVVKAYRTAACAHIDSTIDQLTTTSTDLKRLRQDLVNTEFTGMLPFKLPVNYATKKLSDS